MSFQIFHQQGTCNYCGYIHTGTTCPRVKSIEYYANGTVKKVEFHDPSLPPPAPYPRPPASSL